ncbi:hypothetical protein DESUT3_33100 [Desulfuromonas versatilis]|uniref:Mechanosensitive ion channel n=1 Tax=Desulfuromonas versatilis TaxID=2802975 RepID=A0ABM8HVA4_9BACT|nr:mechanosensitive ion channel [Desulfuromonas versatilis]BCR06241.1 hypothetical protein DESUT3_33100 [Desulfuromonas versatilis]
MPWEPEFWTETLRRILSEIMAWLPTLGAVLLLLIVGWGVARLVQAILAGLLRRLRLDRLAERAGATRFLRDMGMEPSASKLIARLVFWLVLLVFILAAAESLGMRGVTDTLEELVAYLPRVLAAGLILLLGGLVARVVGKALGASAGQAGIKGGLALGQAVRYVILIFVVVLALGQLGVETILLVTTATVLIASAALALAVAFGWGSRDLARNIMAGLHAREEFAPGQMLSVQNYTGRLESIGPIKAALETEAGRVSLPNSVLIEEVVIILAEDKKTS